MPTTSLYLSHWDTAVPVSVSSDVVEDLKNYHVMSVRFLYECFRKQQSGAILNHEDGMNCPIQVSAFLNALNAFITPESPVLIVSSIKSLNIWHYHLANHGKLNVTLLSDENCEEILDANTYTAILTKVDNTKLLREIKGLDFFATIVDELDSVATKAIVKQLKSRFNIGLTNRNFLKDPDQKLFWTMLNWSNPGVVGKFAEFCIEDNNHLENLRCPYSAWWQRLTWKFCESFKPPSEAEQKKYRSDLKNWSVCHKYPYNYVPESRTKRQTRKRKTAAEESVKEESKIEHKDDTCSSKVEPKRQTRKRKVVVKEDFEDQSRIKHDDDLRRLLDSSDESAPNSPKTEFEPKQLALQNLNTSELDTKRSTQIRKITAEKSVTSETERNNDIGKLKLETKRQTRKGKTTAGSDLKVKHNNNLLASTMKTKRQTRTRKGAAEDHPVDKSRIDHDLRNFIDDSSNDSTSNSPNTNKAIEFEPKQTALQNLNEQNQNDSQNSNTSEDTIIYENSPSDNFNKSSFELVQIDVKKETQSSENDVLSMLFDLPKNGSGTVENDRDISDIKNESTHDNKTKYSPPESSSRKNNILSMLYGDDF